MCRIAAERLSDSRMSIVASPRTEKNVAAPLGLQTLDERYGGGAGTIPALGSTVAFATTYPSNVQNPRIEVFCYQKGALVYGEAGGATDSFLLGGGGSVWLWNGGGPADCTANLFYFGMHAGSQTYNLLASTSFAAN
jgi:hypothetical protein